MADEPINTDPVKWYVMRVFKRELQAEDALKGEYGMEHFIPKLFSIRKRHGKEERVLKPSIPGIVFVHANRRGIRQFKEYFPVMQYFYQKCHIGLEKPLTVPDKEMQNFILIARQMMQDISYHDPDEIQLCRGDKVRIIGGVFEGLEGTLLRVKGKRSKRVVVKIEGVVAISSAEIQKEFIERYVETDNKETETLQNDEEKHVMASPDKPKRKYKNTKKPKK